jgi:hypothetical protein
VFGKGVCRFPRGMKLGGHVYIYLVLVVLAPLSPRAGAAVLTKRERKSVLSRKDCERGTSCTAARVLKSCIRGRSSVLKVLLNFLSPRTHAALSEGRGLSSLSCNKLFTVAPKKIWPLCKVAI